MEEKGGALYIIITELNSKKNWVSGNHNSRYRRDSKFSDNAEGGWEARYPEEEVSVSLLRFSNANLLHVYIPLI